MFEHTLKMGGAQVKFESQILHSKGRPRFNHLQDFSHALFRHFRIFLSVAVRNSHPLATREFAAGRGQLLDAVPALLPLAAWVHNEK
jgi:hypothetical protein